MCACLILFKGRHSRCNRLLPLTTQGRKQVLKNTQLFKNWQCQYTNKASIDALQLKIEMYLGLFSLLQLPGNTGTSSALEGAMHNDIRLVFRSIRVSENLIFHNNINIKGKYCTTIYNPIDWRVWEAGFYFHLFS